MELLDNPGKNAYKCYSIQRERKQARAVCVEENNIMNKNELITAVADKSGMTKKETEKILKAFTETVTEELKKGGKVQMVGFGTFEVSERAARDGRNPRTGEPMPIEASRSPKFKAGKALKDAIN